MKIDLHVHTDASDGRESISEVMHLAKEQGLDVLALTDHDTTQGWAEATDLAIELGLGLVPGMELTTRANIPQPDGSVLKFGVHMLNYLPDPQNTKLLQALEGIHVGREERLIEMSDLISKHYFHTWDEVLAQKKPDATFGRPQIVDALIARNYFKTRDEGFEGLWGTIEGIYVPNRKVPDALDAIRLIREAGGVPVVAHPLSRSKSRKPGDPYPIENFRNMIEAGLGGIEVYHRENTPEDRIWLESVALDYDLIITGSSDYHGAKGKENRLAENTTTPEMLARLVEQATGSRPINLP
jgi:predicted metal-dependent phosphoesterase TrpH